MALARVSQKTFGTGDGVGHSPRHGFYPAADSTIRRPPRAFARGNADGGIGKEVFTQETQIAL